MPLFETRPFRPEDREAIVAIGNRDQPPHRQNTAASWARWDKLRKPDLVDLRLCIGEPAIAMLEVSDLNTTPFKLEDVCEFGITVAHEYRGQGIGGMLYEKAIDFARQRGAKRMVTNFREWSPSEPAIAFLQNRGFAEQERETPSFLDLTTWDAAPYNTSLAQAEAYGARLLSFEEIGDTEAHRRLFYELQRALIYDIPRRDTQPFTFEPYEDWVKFLIERPDWRPDLCLVALAGNDWIGQCHVMPKLEAPHVGMQWLTGVSQGHRGQGLATALKVRAYERALAAGVTTVTTENHEDNAPMLAINKKFGFQAEPTMVSYNKVLRE
jgi:GNAT superfamily N-acetyltransferase